MMFLLVLILSIYFISNIWIKWSASPVIITLNSLSTTIMDIPFPAVTICNMNQAQKDAVRQLRRRSDEYSIVQSLCIRAVDSNITNTKSGKWPIFRQILLKVCFSWVSLFIIEEGSLMWDGFCILAIIFVFMNFFMHRRGNYHLVIVFFSLCVPT